MPITLFLFGSEGVLGTLTAAAALVTALALYIYGRAVDGRYRHRTFIISNAVAFVSAIALMSYFPLGALVYLILAPAANSFFDIAAEPIFLGLTEKEMRGDETLRYAFIVDNELFLNTGRIIGICGVLLIAFTASQTTALFLGPVVAAVIQLVFLGLFLRTNDELK